MDHAKENSRNIPSGCANYKLSYQRDLGERGAQQVLSYPKNLDNCHGWQKVRDEHLQPRHN